MMVLFVQTRHSEYHEGLPLLKASGGDTGGGGEGLVVYEKDNDMAGNNRSVVREQSSRKLHGTGRIQSDVSGDQEG